MTVSFLQGVTHACFGLSYLCAFALEVARLFWPGKGWRAASLAFGFAGFAAEVAYIGIHQPSPANPAGSVLLLSCILAVFYLYGTVHHAKQAWGIFVLPVVIGLVALSFVLMHTEATGQATGILGWISGEHFWGAVHGILILLAAVGVTVAFLTSVMYLYQAHRLRNKVLPGRGLSMLNLERLETMSRHAVQAAVPFLTVGLLVGAILINPAHESGENWLSLKVVSTTGLWVVLLVLLYLRYAAHVPPRRLAWLSILAFGLMLVALGAAHPFVEGGAK